MKISEQKRKDMRLAAIDLDGTLLGPDKRISTENRSAVERLSQAGLEVVLASGRHHRSMAPYAEQLPEVKWIVSSQGAEVGTKDRSLLLAHHFMRKEDVHSLMDEQITRGFSAVYYAAEDVFTITDSNADLANYATLSGRIPARVDGTEIQTMDIQKVLWMGDPQSIVSLRSDERLASFGLQGVQTEAKIFEFMPWKTTKAWALNILTDHLGMTRENVLAFGDGENDIPMFDWAGLSYAMLHGAKVSFARASHLSRPGLPETAFARAVDHFLS